MTARQPIGRRIAPIRFILFVLVVIVATPIATHYAGWAMGVMIGFDIAAALFLLSCIGLLREATPEAMRQAARDNDANRATMLVVTALVSLAVLAAVAAELDTAGRPGPPTLALVLATLVLAWMFANAIYTLHYAHLFYLTGPDGKDGGGLDIPGTEEPDYWDFIYFAFTIGMTFQTSDTVIRTGRLRRVVTMHSFAAFVFNLGVIAFTINVLGGG